MVQGLRFQAVLRDLKMYDESRHQFFSVKEYGILNDTPMFCEESLKPISWQLTDEDSSLCNNSIIEANYQIQKNFSIIYKQKMYKSYRVDDRTIKICNSSDKRLLYLWNIRNSRVQWSQIFNECSTTIIIEPLEYLRDATTRKDFSIVMPSKQVIPKEDYFIFNRVFIICWDNIWYDIDSKTRLLLLLMIASLSFSSICLLLLLIVYCMLPNLRTLPGMNLMSLSIAFILWNIYEATFYSMLLYKYFKKIKYCCIPWAISKRITFFSVLTNAVGNVYYLRKRFSDVTHVKPDDRKLKTFLRYVLFTWGLPAFIGIAEFVLAKTSLLAYFDIYRGNQCTYISGISKISYIWYLFIDHILPGIHILYIIVTFIVTSFQIRKKLKESSEIAQTSNIVRNRKNFLILLKLLTITGLTWIPIMFLANYIKIDVHIMMVFYPATLLTGFYLAIAFVFTRKNYQLLKKKFLRHK